MQSGNRLPIARRSNGDCQIGSSSDSSSSIFCAFPDRSSDVLQNLSLLQRRDRAGFSPIFPIKPYGTYFILMKLKTPLLPSSKGVTMQSLPNTNRPGQRMQSGNRLPIARRSNGDCQIGSSSDSRSLIFCAFPDRSSDVLQNLSLLQRRDRAGFSPVFPIKPCGTYFQNIIL